MAELRGIAGCLRRLSASAAAKNAVKAGDAATKLAVFIAVIWWLVEIPDRAKEKHYRAWSVINVAQDRPGDSGRITALEDLNDDNQSLENINLSNAYLRAIQLPGARLRNGNLPQRRSAIGCKADTGI
jgi:hypothetical protein